MWDIFTNVEYICWNSEVVASVLEKIKHYGVIKKWKWNWIEIRNEVHTV